MIDVEDLAFDYPHGRVLDKVSFIVRTGAVLGLVGPPGAGKSTLLRCLASLETPERGRISVAGVDPQRDPGGLRGVLGYVADRYGLYDGLTVRQALIYVARAHGVAEANAAAAVDRSADELGLTDRLDVLVGGLAPFDRERLALAQALVHRPRVLLLDAPLRQSTVPDPPPPWAWAAPLIGRLALTGVTTVVCTQDLAELPPGFTEMLQFDAGVVVGEGVTKLVRAPGAPQAAA